MKNIISKRKNKKKKKIIKLIKNNFKSKYKWFIKFW